MKDVQWEEQCKNLLETMDRSEDAEPFRQPVSVLDEPDYYQKITHPMDLQIVREKLQVGNYATPTDFAKDVRLIFENATAYYTKAKSNNKARIFAMNSRLSLLFENNFPNILASYYNHLESAETRKSKEIYRFPSVFLSSYYSEGKSSSPRSKETKSMPSLVPTNSNKGMQIANDVEAPKEIISVVSGDGMNKGQVRKQMSS